MNHSNGAIENLTNDSFFNAGRLKDHALHGLRVEVLAIRDQGCNGLQMNKITLATRCRAHNLANGRAIFQVNTHGRALNWLTGWQQGRGCSSSHQRYCFSQKVSSVHDSINPHKEKHHGRQRKCRSKECRPKIYWLKVCKYQIEPILNKARHRFWRRIRLVDDIFNDAGIQINPPEAGVAHFVPKLLGCY
jgi:hypothetical protein